MSSNCEKYFSAYDDAEVMDLIIHVVKSGETLHSIAREYGVSPESIIHINSLSNPDRLVVGQTLVIGIPRVTHRVEPGETLFSIARQYGVTLDRLLRNNPQLMGETLIRPGEELVIEYEGGGNRCILTGGYVYPYVEDATLQRTLPNLSYITPFAYGFTGNGDLVTMSDDHIIEKAKQNSVSPVMLLTTLNSDGMFDNNLSHMLLNDVETQEYLICKILENMHLKGYRVLDVDFEFVFPEDREAYAAFIKRLADMLHPYGYEVWVALAPKTSADQRGLLYEAHDYKLLGDIADKLLLMTYEWGYTFGPARSVAPLDQVQKVVEYALTEIPAEKLVLGIPNYGYDFTLPFVKDVSKATVVSNVGAVDLAAEKKAAIEFDDVAMSPFFHYYEDGRQHEVWFEDARSIKAKLDLMDEKNLAGVSFWNLMNYFPQSWAVLLDYCIT